MSGSVVRGAMTRGTSRADSSSAPDIAKRSLDGAVSDLAASRQPATARPIAVTAMVKRVMCDMVHLRRTCVRHSRFVPGSMGMPYGCPATFTGMLLDVCEPFPSSPFALPPQQYAVPLGVTPQLWYHPTLTAAKLRPPGTAVGPVLNSP